MERETIHETKQYRAELTDLSIEHLEEYKQYLTGMVYEHVNNDNSKRLLNFIVFHKHQFANVYDEYLIYSEIRKDIDSNYGKEVFNELVRVNELISNQLKREDKK